MAAVIDDTLLKPFTEVVHGFAGHRGRNGGDFFSCGFTAVPAEEKALVIKTRPPQWAPDYGEPVVPQMEVEDAAVYPEPLDRYLVAQAKTEKPAPRRHRYVARRRNFFERLLVSFINLQKHEPAKSPRKRSRTTSRHG